MGRSGIVYRVDMVVPVRELDGVDGVWGVSVLRCDPCCRGYEGDMALDGGTSVKPGKAS